MVQNQATASTAATERAAAALREQIVQGELVPGSPLREVALAAELDISRNTLREALRLLAAEQLVDLHRHRSAVVTVLSAEDIRDIFVVRRTVELRAVEDSALARPESLHAVQDAAAATERAAAAGGWRDVGTASLRFHQALVGMLDSARLNGLFRTVVAQQRLAFPVAADEADFQRPWVARDREICDLLVAGLRAAAGAALRRYLDDSEQAVLARMHPAAAALTGPGSARPADMTIDPILRGA